MFLSLNSANEIFHYLTFSIANSCLSIVISSSSSSSSESLIVVFDRHYSIDIELYFLARSFRLTRPIWLKEPLVEDNSITRWSKFFKISCLAKAFKKIMRLLLTFMFVIVLKVYVALLLYCILHRCLNYRFELLITNIRRGDWFFDVLIIGINCVSDLRCVWFCDVDF